MHLILTGATGTVGTPILLRGADGCIWAQGTSQTSVSEKEYIRITHDFPVAAAKAFAALSDTGKFNFVHVSGKGAESNISLYGRTKALTETALLELPNIPTYSTLRVFNVRPAYVDAPEYQPRPGIGRRVVYYGLAPILRKLTPGLVTPTDVLSKVCVDLATGDGTPKPKESADVLADGRTLLPAAIRRFGRV
ncbi:NAD(P)-bd-dom domain-containing protein [Mycena venus]|uniref:NAD(P)-bd-dom domain-containing protein n=1 Tax=Mycena venus TaxID=2733690 RepID=A0A8H6X9D0_9AGAR|nr:NAD(P)-bd-dom domain-containing protein [Mycena venus]